jgi:hypothetical protein
VKIKSESPEWTLRLLRVKKCTVWWTIFPKSGSPVSIQKFGSVQTTERISTTPGFAAMVQSTLFGLKI